MHEGLTKWFAPAVVSTSIILMLACGGRADSVGIELTPSGIQAGTIQVPFGHGDDETIAKIQAVLGPPTKDTGWVEAWGDYGACPQPTMRAVEWGSLVTLFTTAETAFSSVPGTEHFFAFSYSNDTAPRELRTPEGIGVGSTLGDLEAAYPGEITIAESDFDPRLGSWSYRLEDWTGLSGAATGIGASDTITSIIGGRGCGE